MACKGLECPEVRANLTLLECCVRDGKNLNRVRAFVLSCHLMLY